MPHRPVDRRTLLTGTVGLAAAALAAGCSGRSPAAGPAAAPAQIGSARPSAAAAAPRVVAAPPASAAGSAATPAQMATRATVPVLCYHQLRDWKSSDGDYSRRFLVCPLANFTAQLDALAEDGYTAIGPDRYLAHLTTGAPLPAKPVLLSFDDSQGSQVSQGLPRLQERDMTATFFCMTVVLDKPGWMSRTDLRRLGDAGMTVAAHSYDHGRADRYRGADWGRQLDQPRELLEKAVRRPVEHFAYPYGAWGRQGFGPLRAAGYRTAFQLSDDRLDRTAPHYTLRRILVDSNWTGPQVLREVRRPV